MEKQQTKRAVGRPKAKKMVELTGDAVKQELWNMMFKVQNGEVAAPVANALAGQAREIVKVTRAELDIAAAFSRKPSRNLRKFAKL